MTDESGSVTAEADTLSRFEAAYTIASLLDTDVLPPLPGAIEGWPSEQPLREWLSTGLRRWLALSDGEQTVLAATMWAMGGAVDRRYVPVEEQVAALLRLLNLDADLRAAIFDTLGRLG